MTGGPTHHMSFTGGVQPLREPLIQQRPEACRECWGCVRVCPVRAIRVVDGHSEVIHEKCVDCGLCVNECGNRGHVVRDDTAVVLDLLRGRTPVVALLATEFAAALHPLTTAQIERALETLGFLGIESTLLGEELVAREYERVHAREDMLFVLRSTCPVANRFVQKYYPAFAPALAPVVPPYVAQARLIKAAYEVDVSVVYVSPCYARKDEAFDPQFGGAVDACIDFIELRYLIEHADGYPARGRATRQSARRPHLLKEVSLTDGFPRHTLASRDMTDSAVHVVRGLPALDRLLRAMAAGEAAPAIVDMLNCEGCIDGPAVNPGLSLFAKRNIERAANEMPGTTRVSTRELLGVLPTVDLVRSFGAAPVVEPEPSVAELASVLAAGGFSEDDVIDCGACGYPTCEAHARAIYQGLSTWEMCFPLQRSRLRDASEALAAAQTLDALTGIWNRRAFTDRLALETARFQRYRTPLSLVLVDIDGFSAINDELGEAAGDAVLRAVGDRLVEGVRSTDMVARYSGDTFALLLPGIGKTSAFAVAEKVRAAFREEPVTVEVGGYTHTVPLTLCAGVSTAGSSATEPIEIVESADAALREAVGAGKDEARLAPG